MASKFRQAHVHMWKDTWFTTLDPVDKLLFIYLFTNERAHTCGVYQIPLQFMLLEIGIEADRLHQGLATLQESGRVCYDEESGHCFVRNLMRYNGANLMTNARMRADLRTYRATEGASLRYWDLWCQTYPSEAAKVFEAQEKEKKEKKEQEEKEKAAATPGRASAVAEGLSGVETASSSSSSSSSSTASSSGFPTPPGLEVVLQLVEEAWQEPPSPLDRRRLQEMAATAEAHRLTLRQGQCGADRSGVDWLRQAIEDANAARRPGSALSLKFIDSVLQRWLVEGYQAPWGGHDEPDPSDYVEWWPEES